MTGVRLMRRKDGEELLDPDFVKAIGHPIRVEILLECSLAPICVSEFRVRRRPELRRQAIEHHFSILLECGAIEVVKTRRERGGRARYYSATARALFSEEDFDRMPPALQGSLTATYCSTLFERIKESLLAGTLEAHSERHLTWTPLELDLEGFLKVAGELDGFFERLKLIELEAKERMDLAGASALHSTVAMMAFESPPPIRDHQVDA
jgi:DNA-binding transcriptional ArsR family regulator